MSVWTVLVHYATKIEPGIIEVEYEVDDLSDVLTIIDQGPGGFSSVAYVHIRRGDTERYPVLWIEGGSAEHARILKDLDK